MQWNSAEGDFTVVGFQTCGNNGCVTSTVAPATVNSSAFNTVPVSGWANSYGGSINIPSTARRSGGRRGVLLHPIERGSRDRCATLHYESVPVAQIAGYTSATLSTPYANGTDMQWFSALLVLAGLLDSTSTPVVWENPPGQSQYAQNGLQTGWLIEASLTNANCPVGGFDAQAGHLCQPANPATYYTW